MSTPNITTKFSLPAWLRKVNPLSFGSGQPQYVPKWFINLFKSRTDSGYNRSGNPEKLAHIMDKSIHGAAAVAVLTLAARAAMHWAKVDNLSEMNPDKNAADDLKIAQMQTDPLLDSRYSKNIKKEAALDPYAKSIATIPLVSALATLVAAVSVTDKYYDKKLGENLDEKLMDAETKSQKIAQERILRARGVKSDGMIKQQAFGLPVNIQGAIAILSLALGTAGFYIGKNWHQDNSKAYANYKANKKGLKELMDSKFRDSTIPSKPLNEDFIALADSRLPKTKNNSTNTEPIKQIDLV